MRAFSKLLLGETVLLPVGLAVVFGVLLRLRPVTGHSWDHLGGFLLLAGVVALLLVSVAHSAHVRPRRPRAATLVVWATAR